MYHKNTALPIDQLRFDMTLDVRALFPGDIIATTSRGRSSEAIRWATNGIFSHAIMYIGNKYCVEATPERGVTKASLVDATKNSQYALVFRHRTASSSGCALAAQWAAAQAGKPYDFAGAARVGLQPGARTAPLRIAAPGLLITAVDELDATRAAGHDASFFCSELIARAYQVAGEPIVDTPVYLTGPNRFLQTDKLALMGKLGSAV